MEDKNRPGSPELNQNLIPNLGFRMPYILLYMSLILESWWINLASGQRCVLGQAFNESDK